MSDKFTLREIRLMREITQLEVAEYLGVERTTYAAWEKLNKFDFAVVLKLCELYKVDILQIKA